MFLISTVNPWRERGDLEICSAPELEPGYITTTAFGVVAQFLAEFFPTQKRVNHDKTDIATKLRKSRFWNKTA